MTGPVALLGLDALDVDALRQWVGEGELPVLGGLLATGVAVPTEAPPGVLVGAVWPSILTGVNPGRHGYHCWQQVRPGRYGSERHRVRDEGLGADPVWVPVGRAGRRILVVDPPHAPLVTGLPGAQLLDWGGHDSDQAPLSDPPGLAEEVLARWGRHPSWGNCNAHDRTAADHVRFRDGLVGGAATKAALVEELVDREAPDLVVCVFGEPHCIGHQSWHLHDPTSPACDATLCDEVGDPVLAVYRAVDEAVGRLLGALGPDAVVLALASHGMGTHTDPTFLLDEVLLRLDAARRFDRERRWLQRLYRSQDRAGRLGRVLERPLAALGRRHHDRYHAWCAGAGLADRRWYRQPNNEVEGGIRLNLAGREPAGIIEPREADAEMDWLVGELEQLTDESGAPVVRDVIRTRDRYHGPFVDQLPDLLVRWNRGGMKDRLSSPRIGEVHAPYTGARSGAHHGRGLLMASGPGIEPGVVSEVHPVEDVAATIAALFGLPVDGYDGTPIEAVVPAPAPAR